MLIQTYNIEIIIDGAERVHWLNLLNEARAAFNDCATIMWGERRLSLKVCHDMCYRQMREKHPLLTSQMVTKCYQTAMAAIKSIRSNKHHNAKCPEKRGLCMLLDKRLYDHLDISGISITGSVKRKRTRCSFVRYQKIEEMFATYKAHDPSIFYRGGRFFLSVPFEVPETPVDGNKCIGIDLGIRQLFVTSEGKSFRDQKYLAARRRIRYNKRALSKKRTKSAKRHYNKLRKREQNLSKDMCYRAAKALLQSTKASYLVMEDLTKIKQKTAKTNDGHNRKRHNNTMSQVPFYMFRKIIEQKALFFGKKTETVNPAYTSQADFRTGKCDGARRGREFVTYDGLVFDADWNAALNIGQKSKHPVLGSLPLAGRIIPVSGRCQSMHRTPSTY